MSYKATINNYEINSDRVIIYINDDRFKKTIKINILSDNEIIKQWLIRHIDTNKNHTF